jgi:hypothetical protein
MKPQEVKKMSQKVLGMGVKPFEGWLGLAGRSRQADEGSGGRGEFVEDEGENNIFSVQKILADIFTLNLTFKDNKERLFGVLHRYTRLTYDPHPPEESRLKSGLQEFIQEIPQIILLYFKVSG